MKKFFVSFSLFLFIYSFSWGQAPNGYYDDANGLDGAELKTALSSIISGHTSLSYKALWTAFQYTDKKPNGKVWDMYSDIPGGTPAYEFTFITDQCGNYSGEGSCYNREHSFPKSWFNDGTPMYSDMFHLVPTDGYVNGQRGNYPFGEVGSASWTSTNGSKKGTCSYPGYSGTVFEPIDEYKGDFARGYFYMATRYESNISGWSSPMLNGTSYPAYTEWAVNLLMDWHEQDP
ncbi:MAG: endonuclease, partial [Bacteroidales bacterium]|nr:endonuclease [Bacteroidales bacterium]